MGLGLHIGIDPMDGMDHFDVTRKARVVESGARRLTWGVRSILLESAVLPFVLFTIASRPCNGPSA